MVELDNEKTIKRLKEMLLPVMAEAFKEQAETTNYTKYSFEERFTYIVNKEYDSRVNHTIERNIKNAKFYDSTANLNDVNYKPDRNLDKGLIESLRTNDYIRNGLNIILIGASGSGKTWLSCAFGTNACLSKMKARYIRMPELFSEFEAKRIQGNYRQYLNQLFKYDLLIIDEFLLSRTNETERNDLLELMEKRTNKKSTIFCSQWSPEGWHEKLGNGPVADAILDRIFNSSYEIFLEGKSLREEYSKLK